MEIIKTTPLLPKLYIGLIWLALVYFFGYWLLQCVDLVNYPLPTEYRDWGMVDLSLELANNSAPYSFGQGPPFFFIYGFLFSWIVGVIGSLAGIDPFLLSKLAVFGCVVLAAVIVALEVLDITRSRLFAVLGFSLMLWASANAGVFFILRPDSFGLLITLLVLTLIRRAGKPATAENPLALVLAAAGVILAFYTKQYFAFIFPAILLFLIFPLRIKALLIFAGTFFVLFALSVVAVLKFFPAYFYASILAQAYSVGGTWHYAIWQFERFSSYYWPLMFLVVLYIRQRAKPDHLPAGGTNVLSRLFSQGISGQREGIYFCVLIVAAACLIPLSKNEGSFLSYYYQLALPSLIIVGLAAMSKLRSQKSQNIFIALIVLFSILHGKLFSYAPLYSEQSIANWQSADQLFATRKGSAKLISSPILANLPSRDSAIVLDNGHTECYLKLNPVTDKTALLDLLFPKRSAYLQSFKEYFERIQRRIQQREFTLIAVTKDFHPMIPQALLDLNYNKIQEINLQTGNQNWMVEFWVPKG